MTCIMEEDLETKFGDNDGDVPPVVDTAFGGGAPFVFGETVEVLMYAVDGYDEWVPAIVTKDAYQPTGIRSERWLVEVTLGLIGLHRVESSAYCDADGTSDTIRRT